MDRILGRLYSISYLGLGFGPEVTKSIVKGIGIGFLSCIGIGIAKTIFQVLVLVLLR